MATKKKYESMRIMSLEGSMLCKGDVFTATMDGKPDPQAFRGILDESLDTLKLAEVYSRHEDEMGYPYLDGKKRFCRAVVSLFLCLLKLNICGFISGWTFCPLGGYFGIKATLCRFDFRIKSSK